MKNIIIIAVLAAFPVLLMPGSAFAQTTAGTQISTAQPAVEPVKNKRKRPPPMPITPGSQIIIFKDKIKAEIRPDKSVWWFGVNQKKALVADGVHELKDGQKIKTLGGKLVSKPPKPSPSVKHPSPASPISPAS